MAQDLDTSTFDSLVRNGQGVAIVDFWAPWCTPCTMLAPILEQAENEVGESASFYKLNVDENPELAGEFGVRSIPTILVFKDGHAVEQIVGLRNKETYIQSISQHTSA